MAVYIGGLALVYVALRHAKFWKLLRLDVLIGGGLLLVLDVAWFGRSLSDIRRLQTSARLNVTTIGWLLLIIDAVEALLTAGMVGATIYAMGKLKKHKDLVLGNVVKPRKLPSPLHGTRADRFHSYRT